MATPAQREAAKKVAKNATVKAWYNRPAGSFYRSILSTGGSFYSPAIMNPSSRPVTWPNASEGADSYSWSYEKYNAEIKDFSEYTSSEADLTDSWIWESAYAPTLTATSGGATDTYQLFANFYNDKTGETKSYQGVAYFCPDPRAEFEESNLDCYVSPKLWAAGVREQSPGLSQGGGMVYLTGAKDAENARMFLRQYQFNLLIVDVMMPNESGIEFLQKLRRDSNVPAIILTAMGDTADRIVGLEAGADDYLPKPFEPKELVLRINNILRRVPAENAVSHSLTLGSFVFDLDKKELVAEDGEIVHITPVEQAILCVLGAKSGQIFTRERLAELLGANQSPRSIDVQITRLRKKIETDSKNPRYLQTVRGKGYMLLTK